MSLVQVQLPRFGLEAARMTSLYTKRLQDLELRLMTAVARGDSPSAGKLAREIEIARCGGSTSLDFDDFRAGVLQKTLGKLIPTRGFNVRATKEQMADLAKLLRQRVGL